MRTTEQRRLEFVVASEFLFIDQLHTGAQRYLFNKLLCAVAHQGLLFFWRHNQAFAAIDRDAELKIAHAQGVTIKQAARIALADGFHLIVDVDAIATGVYEVIDATLKIDGSMPSGYEAIRVGKNPVVL